MIVQGNDNPVYLTQRIDSFIREFRQMLVDYPMQDFAQVVATAIVMRRTAALSLHIETLRFWNCISKGEYDFGSRERKARQVEKLTKQDLVDVWDMFINPETAADYTRVDMHMWSAELGCPSSKILRKYPEYLLSLAGCLQSDGISGVDLKTLHLFIERAACEKHLENALNELQQLYAQSGSNRAESAKTKTALAYAIALFKQHAEQPQARHANMHMHQTPEGKWIIDDICKFKDAQSAHGIASPAIKLEPKFADPQSS
ncbi:metalloprotease [Coemansia sp. RSA 2706]|nr:metalloprotease [Coemansia sp. RSA 2706]KAJ2302313.1 metalloprotease [Coemansia sp. RSA 2705]KAJ2314101.1 metalloprotease [Coemansia sp. RSA 2704]KAJ2384883.1 metalloprotease [Coemansia sp. RSA 2611]KAJ2714065.1 metalloprotease [Coemansia sp. Cherry 401B]